MISRCRRTLAIFLTPLMVLLAFPAPARAEEVIRLNGTGSGIVLVKPLMAAFRKAHPQVRFEVEKSLGSAASLKAIAAGALDVAVAGRHLKAQEMQPHLEWREYGSIPYAVITHRDSKVDNVTTAQLADMYSGKYARWPDGELVRVILRPQEDVDTKILRTLSKEMDAAVSAAHARKDMVMGVTDQESFENIKKVPGSVCFMPLSMLLSEPGKGNVSRLNGVEPTPANVASGKYPYAKSIFVVTRKQGPAAARRFVEFMNSRKGLALAAKLGLVPASGR